MIDRAKVAEAFRVIAAAIEAPAEPAAPALPAEASALGWVPIRSCGLPERTVRRAVREREIGASRIGRDVFVDMRDVRAYVERRRLDAPRPDEDEVDRAMRAKRLRVVGGRGR
jgi:excisionase family DNA binding protein